LSNVNAESFDCDPVRVTSRVAAIPRLLLPQCCELCAARTCGSLLCAACAEALPRVGAACPVCALPSAAEGACGACLALPPPYAATVAAFAYAFPIDRLLQRIKYGGRIALAQWAGAALAAALHGPRARRTGRPRPDCIVALPLAAARQRDRGFNQASEIAARVARDTGLPLATPLARITAGPPQTALSWTERGRNVRGAFAIRAPVGGARIALVDDVMTTGATLAEAARTLLHAGAEQVECWVVARTLPP
jgi:ComF family protein